MYVVIAQFGCYNCLLYTKFKYFSTMALFSEYSWDSRDYLFAQIILSRHTNKLSMFEYLLVLQIF